MGIFNELNITQKMPDPHERTPAELERSKKTLLKRKAKSSSVDGEHAMKGIKFVQILSGIACAGFVIWLIYTGINIFLGM